MDIACAVRSYGIRAQKHHMCAESTLKWCVLYMFYRTTPTNPGDLVFFTEGHRCWLEAGSHCSPDAYLGVSSNSCNFSNMQIPLAPCKLVPRT